MSGVPADKTRTISSAVDKLDKLPWEEVKKEMTEEKGLDASVADKIGEYVKLKGARWNAAVCNQNMLSTCVPRQRRIAGKAASRRKLNEEQASERRSAGYEAFVPVSKGLRHLRKGRPHQAWREKSVLPAPLQMSFDLSLARGLDYYTGIIYEVVTAESAPPGALPASLENHAAADASTTGAAPQTTGTNPEDEDAKVGVGSIAAGGRYDNLVGMFSPSGQQIPCVGISFGVERIFSILWKKRLAEAKEKEVKSKEVDVFVMAVGDGLLLERMQIAKELWDAGLRASPTFSAFFKRPADLALLDRVPIQSQAESASSI